MTRRRRQAREIAGLEAELRDAKDRHRPRILAHLATLYEAAGRAQDARDAYQEVLASRDPDVSAYAALSLGAEREEAGRLDEAATFYEQAMLFRTEESFLAAGGLARLLLDRADFEAARRPLRFAATSTNEQLATSATMALSALAEQRGNDWGARILRERAERALKALP